MTSDHTLGTIGIWSSGLRADDPSRHADITEAAAELDELGYGTIWVGGSPSVAQAALLLEATERATVGTSILSIWQHAASDVAAQVAELGPAASRRFLLGLGVSHAPLAEQYARPYSAMKEYLSALDTAPVPVPRERRMLAALGPKMLELARDRAAGAVPYLVTVEHTAQAREALGGDALLAPELKVVLDSDLDRARATARAYLSYYLPLPNYTNNLLRLGFAEDDFRDGGSDRLLDAVFVLGDVEATATRVDDYLGAGADHLALQVVTDDMRGELPRAAWRRLAEALPLSR